MALYNRNKENKISNDFLHEKKEEQQPVEKKDILRFALLKDERARKIMGFFLVMLSLFMALAFTSSLFSWSTDQDVVLDSNWSILMRENPDAASNWMGLLGALTAHVFIYKWFGIASYAFVLVIFLLGVRILFKTELLPFWKTTRYGFFVMIWLSITLGFIFSDKLSVLGGAFGHHSFGWLKGLLGTFGAIMFLLTYLVIFLIVTYNLNFFLPKAMQPALAAEPASVPEDFSMTEEVVNEAELEEFSSGLEIKEIMEEAPFKADESKIEKSEPVTFSLDPEIPVPAKAAPVPDLKLDIVAPKEEVAEEELPKEQITHRGLDEAYDPTLDLSGYQFPSLDLLNSYDDKKAQVDTRELEESKNLIIETLRNYNIAISQIKATIGPTVTLYEIVPAPGVKISKIKNLEDDIALSLAALGIRIIAPIPGKGTIGIEVPNKHPEMVAMKTALASSKFQHSDFDLPVCLGKTISNEVYVADLTKMPHLLMAGATGQGKSVGLNSLLVSILYKKHPSQVKFVLVDPKKVELTLFKTIERHFLAKLPGDGEAIITDNKLVINTLNSLCIEMDKRYELLQAAQVRNIKEYNARFIERRLNPNDGHKFLPYIVVVIDEVADLIMTAGKEVEHPIARLAQLARAIGIHLVLATQRPSVNIITGTIKANFPARIAFRVTSKIDSRTILDASGADQLIGRGDLLYSSGNDIIRLQCPFVDTPEVERITNFIGGQRGIGVFLLPEYVDENSSGASEDFDPSEKDNLFDEAARIVVMTQQGSTSTLQRKLKIGYNRAGRLIDQLEHFGVVGPFQGSKARDVLVPDEYALEQLLRQIDEEVRK